MHDDHDHPNDGDDGHAHPHHGAPPDPLVARTAALRESLVGRGLVDPATMQAILDLYEKEVGPHNGASVVARAWTDPEYLEWLRRDATAAIRAMGYGGRQGEHMVAVENTPSVHNMIVCTLCSCYPWPVLGLPPAWYKSHAYRARAVSEPRAVLREFGVVLPDSTEVRVWDSTAEVRYLVIPRRPAGTEGLSEAELAALVTRDSMIGTAVIAPR
ncbi:MAG: nitrile hydratase subunit alpha [Acetobacteraceae bacterium]|nr:nitrile hydratase subunit alpha [Acetobacteraceae bacterium]